MARVLFAWEFGGDLGHARRLVPIARELRAMGHEPCFAFRDVSLLGHLAGEGHAWFAAPRLRLPAAPDPSPLNAADILLNLGYADANALTGALRAWLSLYALLSPALLVADYAPTALVAARAAGLARVTLGTGFSVPPRGEPLPALRAWQPVDEAVLRKRDTQLVNNVSRSLERLSRSAAAPRTAWDVFDADAHLLCTFDALDPFGPRAGVEYLGAQGDAGSGAKLEWLAGEGPRIFAYLKPRDARFDAIVEGLATLKADAIVAAPGLDPAAAAERSREGVRVVAQPVRLEGLLERAHLCLFHGGPGLAARALACGVPMALLPRQLEQYLVSLRLVDSGAARVIAPQQALPPFETWLRALLADETLRAAATLQARKHRDYRFDEAATRTARRIASALTT